jgi:hypothetical protein
MMRQMEALKTTASVASIPAVKPESGSSETEDEAPLSPLRSPMGSPGGQVDVRAMTAPSSQDRFNSARPTSAPTQKAQTATDWDLVAVPDGWERAWTSSGKTYYKNHMERSTQFAHPSDPNPKSRSRKTSKAWE